MNLSTFITWWVGLCYSHIYGSIIKLKSGNDQELKYPALIVHLNTYKLRVLHAPFVTACPASTQKEQQFNQEVSITGKSVFLQNLYRANDSVKLDFCDTPIEPAMVYNVETNKYEIGYELYYEQEKIKLRDIGYGTIEDHSILESYRVKLEDGSYHRYKSVDINNQIINQSKFLNANQFIIEQKNATNTKFAFTDGSPTMEFYWMPIVRITSEEYNKQIVLTFGNDIFVQHDTGERKIFSALAVKDYDLKSKCQDFEMNKKQPKLRIFSKQNQPKNLKEEPTTAKQLYPPNEQRKSFDDLTRSQISHLWWYTTFFAQLASCTHMNMVPIWTSIAEGQLKKVDLYLHAVKSKLKCDVKQLIFGVIGALTLRNTTDEKIFAFDTEHGQIIPIPKIIYRVIEAECSTWDDEYLYNAIIVIHNDPTGVSDDDRICQEEDEVGGWDKIKNDEPTTGITYVCQYRTKKLISEKLGIHVGNDAKLTYPLNLNYIPEQRRWASDDVGTLDNTYDINTEFEKLLNEHV